jgi:hypothetical protein
VTFADADLLSESTTKRLARRKFIAMGKIPYGEEKANTILAHFPQSGRGDGNALDDL